MTARRVGSRRRPGGGRRLAAALAAIPVALGLLLATPGAAAAGEPPAVPFRLTGDACTPASTGTGPAGWQRTALGLDRLHGFGTGAGVTVAVVDTGVAADVPGLAGRVTGTEPDAPGHGDCVGHGTFLAGLVAAAGSGIAPGSRVLAVADTDRRGVADTAAVAAGIRSAAAGGAAVIVVGTVAVGTDAPLRSAVAAARSRDALVVAPTVADGELPGANRVARNPLARLPGVLAVTGATRSGAVLVRGAEPGLLAPGGAVSGIGPGGGDFVGTGSSLAAALVGGAAAVLRAREPGLSAGQVAARLRGTAWQAVDGPALDPVAAVTETAATGTAVARPAPPPVRPHRADGWAAARLALPVGAAAIGAICVLAAAAGFARAARRRPGRRRPEPARRRRPDTAAGDAPA